MNTLTSSLLGIAWLLACCGLVGTVHGQTSSFAVSSTSVNGYEVGGFSIAPLSDTGEGYSGCANASAPDPGPGPGPAPLPLLVTDLAAHRDDATTVELTWELEDGDVPYRWALERRLDAEADFTEIRELPTPLLLRRRYLDNNPYAGTSYYRIRGVAADGAEAMSRIRAVDNGFDPAGLLVYPNPVRRTATVRVPGTERAFTLVLSDQLGRRVWGRSYPARAANPLRLSWPDLPAGIYLLRWAAGDAREGTRRVVIGH